MKGDAGGTSLIMTHRASSPLGILLIVGLAGALTAPCRGLTAQALDSTGMPSLDLLAMEAGRASRRHPISTHGGARSAEGPFRHTVMPGYTLNRMCMMSPSATT